MEPIRSSEPMEESSADDPRRVHAQIASRIAELQQQRSQHRAARATPRPSVRLVQRLFSAARFLFS